MYIQVRFVGRADRGMASASSARLSPSGVISNAHAKMSAMGKPMTIKTTISRTISFGTPNTGKTCAIPLGERPASDDVSERDLVNVATLQFTEEGLRVHTHPPVSSIEFVYRTLTANRRERTRIAAVAAAVSAALLLSSFRRPPAPDPAEIGFVFIAESPSQSRLLVQHNEQVSYQKEQAGIDKYRQRL